MNPISNSNLPSPFLCGWESARDEIRDLDQYGPNWDGDGGERVPNELILAALHFCATLERLRFLPPTSVYPTSGGTVMLECPLSSGGVLSANIRTPNEAEVLFRGPGKAPEFEIIKLVADAVDKVRIIHRDKGVVLHDDTEFALAA